MTTIQFDLPSIDQVRDPPSALGRRTRIPAPPLGKHGTTKSK